MTWGEQAPLVDESQAATARYEYGTSSSTEYHLAASSEDEYFTWVVDNMTRQSSLAFAQLIE